MADDAKKAAESAEKANTAAVQPRPQPPVSRTQAAAPAAEEQAPMAGSAETAPALKPAELATPTPLANADEGLPDSGPVTRTKEFTMANPDFTRTMADAMSEVQTRAKEAYEKSAEMAGEASELAKDNIEAMVESGRILSSGMQDMSKSYLDQTRNAFETLTADLKEIAAARSPTELFQLQGKLMRRNFDSMVAFGSRNSEAMVKLANESMGPISNRMSVAADKVSKAAA